MHFTTEDGNLTERWRVWQESIELYLDLAMKSSGESEKCKAVLYIIGEEGRKIFNTWSIPDGEREKVQPLLTRFREYCTPRNNITLERYKFNTRVQKPDETVDQFVVDLRQMAKTCDYGVLEEDTDESELDENDGHNFHIGEVTKKNDGQSETEWKVELKTKDKNTFKAKVDTGAQVNVMSLKEACRIGGQLKKCKDRLTSYSGDQIPVEGQIEIICKRKRQEKRIKFVVTSQREAQTILGLQSSVDLKLIKKKMHEVKQNKSLDKLLSQYKDTFGELGKMETEYEMKVKDDIDPIVSTARKIPYAQREKVLKELNRMEKLGVIVKEDGPTEWVNPIIVVNKPNGRVGICMDPQRLNQALKREYYQIPTVEDIASKMPGASYYSKLDASSGFYQIPLSEESSKLCTFATPFGRWRFKRMPFGISSAPEVFQRTMDGFFGDLEGVVCYEDDICIFSSTTEEHMKRLESVLQRTRDCGLKFNEKKCEFLKEEISYLGHIFTKNGTKVDPKKVSAVKNMPNPTNRKELQRFLGMVTYLSKYI